MLRNFMFPNLKHIKFRTEYTWTHPTGVDIGVKIYNPMVKKKVSLRKSTDDPYLTWYSCGPTVYDSTHIGHACCYVRLDIIRRVLKNWFGMSPVYALGITDIDDKIIKKSVEQKISCNEIAKSYELEFFRDMSSLNVLEPNFVLRVTEHIPDIIEFIGQLIEKNHAYVSEHGHVYFDTKSLSTYGKVTKAPVLEETAVQKGGDRRHQADFALWKASRDGEPSWKSPWSDGRPGWHIECSVMASKLFGPEISIHSGGVDLAFPHHENEEAQSCAFHSTDQWVNYWIRTGPLMKSGLKMSKSLSNYITVPSFLEKFSADNFRMMCLITHYRTNVDYSENFMNKAVSFTDKFNAFLHTCNNYCKGSWDLGEISSPLLLEVLETTESGIKESLADDFNTAKCLNLLEDLVIQCNLMFHAQKSATIAREPVSVHLVKESVQKILQSFGLLQQSANTDTSNTAGFILATSLELRSTVRRHALQLSDPSAKKELLGACDLFRNQLKSVNITVKDNSLIKSSWSKE